MSQPIDGFVTVPPNSTGQNVRQVVLQIVGADGVIRNQLVEVVAISDPVTGRILDLEQTEWRNEVLVLLRAMVRGISNLCVAEDVDSDLLDDSMQNVEGG
jgi:hypothetical protein